MIGVDLSNHNAGFNEWQGVGFAWIKATQGTTFVDAEAAGFVQAAHDRGIPWGTYHFAEPDLHSAVAEANFYLMHAHVPSPLPAALDVETRTIAGRTIDPLGILGAPALAGWVNDWCSMVAAATGQRPFVYVNRGYADHLLPLLAPWPLWLATLDGSIPSSWSGRPVDVVQYAIVGGIDHNQSLTELPNQPTHSEDDMPATLVALDDGAVIAIPSCGGRPWHVPNPDELAVELFTHAFAGPPGAPLNKVQSDAIRAALDRQVGTNPPPWPDADPSSSGPSSAPTHFTGTVDITAAQ